MAALAAVLDANPNAKVLPALRRGNVVGALSVGMAPADADHDGLATLRAAADGKLDLLILLGADPLNDCPDVHLARRALAGARRVISIDTHPSESTKLADVVLAAAAYGEKRGTTTNIEGRVSTLADKVTTTGTARPDWMIAAELSLMLDFDGGLAEVATCRRGHRGDRRRGARIRRCHRSMRSPPTATACSPRSSRQLARPSNGVPASATATTIDSS